MAASGVDCDTVVASRGSTSPATACGELVSPLSKAVHGKAQEGRDTQKNACNEEVNGPKLRSSCRSCANSRVRCNKEKPICSRCEARGIECQYLQSKRPGRVPGSGARKLQPNQLADRPEIGRAVASEDTATSTTINNSIARRSDNMPKSFASPAPSGLGLDYPSIDNRFRVDSIFSAPDGMSDAGFFASALGADNEPHTNIDDSNLLAQTDSFSMLSTMDDITYGDLTTYDTGLGDLNSWWPFVDKEATLSDSSLDESTRDFLAQLTSNSNTTDTSTEPSSVPPSSLPSAVSLNDLSNSVPSTLFGSETKQSQPTPPELQMSSSLGNTAIFSCHCVAQALDLLKTMSKAQSSVASPISGDSYTQKILAENKQAIDTTLVVLVCPSCSEDKFLLMIHLMTTTKILTRYASAAALCGARDATTSTTASGDPMQISTTQGDEPANPNSEHTARLVSMSRAWGGSEVLVTTTGNGRESVQKVLRELHQVQRLIAQLSIRRKSIDSPEANLTGKVGLMDASLMPVGKDTNSNSRTGMPPRSNSNDSAVNAATTTPLSANALDVVEGDVRRSLSALSAVVRGVLRNS